LDLELKLYNITDHKHLDRVSKTKFTNRQKLSDFNVIDNKYSDDQISYTEDCYLQLISDYRFHQLKGKKKDEYSEKFLQDYFDGYACSDPLTFDEFLQIIKYLEIQHGKSIFASINFSKPQHTAAITSREERYIMDIFKDYDMFIKDAYIETETDEYGDVYEYMYVIASTSSFRDLKLLEADLYSLEQLFGITFEIQRNGIGRFGRTYEFAHYFE